MIKILACLGVVSLHTLYPGKGWITRGITLLAGMSIPLFFMVSGYLMLRRESLDYKYAIKKIGRILLVCFSWELLHAIAYFMYYREMRDFLTSFVMDFFQEGLFYHFWYMGGLILIYLLMPLIGRLWEASPRVYCNVLVGLSVLNITLDLVAIILGDYFILEVPQNLRIHYWLLYAMLGGWLARNSDRAVEIYGWIKPWLIPASFVGMMVFLYIVGTYFFKRITVEAFYGSLPIQLTTFVLFVFLRGLKYSERAGRMVPLFSELTMGIYIMHPFVLAVYKKYMPVFVQGDVLMNLLFWIITTVSCGIVTALVRKIPVLNQLFKL